MFVVSEHVGELVEVYLDNHSFRRWIVDSFHGSPSRRSKDRLNGLTGHDAEETLELGLTECQFYVHPSGWERCRVGKKNPHAWVIGKVINADEVRRSCSVEIGYKCKRDETFVMAADLKRPVLNADAAVFTVRHGRLRVFATPGPSSEKDYYKKQTAKTGRVTKGSTK